MSLGGGVLAFSRCIVSRRIKPLIHCIATFVTGNQFRESFKSTLVQTLLFKFAEPEICSLEESIASEASDVRSMN